MTRYEGYAMSNAITNNPFLNTLFDTKELNQQPKTGFDVAELAKAKNQADQMAKQASSTESHNQVANSSVMATMAEQSYHYSETMSLQLTTKEGDTVSVDFKQLYSQYQSYMQMQSSQAGPQGVKQFDSKQALESTQFVEQFGFSVEGDLNENELNAIFDVFEQVDSLANQFFDGNIEKALQQAIELDINFEHLDTFSLNLTQTQSMTTRYQQAAVAEYADVQQQSEPSADSYGVNMNDLPPYLQNWQTALDRLDEQFTNAQEFLNNMVGNVVADRFPEQATRPDWLDRIQAFHQQLMDMAQPNHAETAKQTDADVNQPVNTQV